MASALPLWTFYLDGLVTLHVLYHPEPLSDSNPVFYIRAQDDPLPRGYLKLPGKMEARTD